MPQSQFAALLAQNNLPASFIYLAPALPVVQVMWADGKNQIPERAKLHLVIQAHCEALSELAGGVEVVSEDDQESFHQIFIANRPDMDLLKDLTGIATDLIDQHPDSKQSSTNSLYSRERLFHVCLEIAATCESETRTSTGETFSQRIVEEERDFIQRVFDLLPQEWS